MESDLMQLVQQLERIIEKQVSHLSMMQRNNDTPSDAAVIMWNMFNKKLIPLVTSESEYRKGDKALFQNKKLYITLTILRTAMRNYTGENPPRYRSLTDELKKLGMLDSIKDFHGHHCYVVDMEMIKQYCDSLRNLNEPVKDAQLPHL